MSNTVYILYDHTIENEESLDKFKVILKHAGFKEELLKTISLQDYQEYLENNDFKFYSNMICINQTFKIINQIYSEKLDIPIFDFFSKEYVNEQDNIILYGLLYSVSSIYEVAYKKYAWSVVQKFYNDYKLLNKDSITIQEEEHVTEHVEESFKEDEETIQTEQIQVSDTQEKQSMIIENEHQPSYEELLSFYKNTKKLLSQFSLIQQQTKSLEFLLNASD